MYRTVLVVRTPSSFLLNVYSVGFTNAFPAVSSSLPSQPSLFVPWEHPKVTSTVPCYATPTRVTTSVVPPPASPFRVEVFVPMTCKHEYEHRIVDGRRVLTKLSNLLSMRVACTEMDEQSLVRERFCW